MRPFYEADQAKELAEELARLMAQAQRDLDRKARQQALGLLARLAALAALSLLATLLVLAPAVLTFAWLVH